MATTTTTTTTEAVQAVPSERATQVRIRLGTKVEDIQLPDTGPILVSTELRRYQLSLLVNRLLETTSPIPLEFLINGQFLRTSLDDFLTRNGISAETTLQIEYVRALLPPVHVASYEHDDWVSSVDVLSTSSLAARNVSQHLPSPRVLSGSYDGLLRVWNMSSEVIATGTGHTAAVKAVRFASPTQIISSGIDRTIRIWKYADTATSSTIQPYLELYGHTASVDSLAVHPSSSRILSASADHTIGFWSVQKSDSPSAPENLLPSSTSNKRRKVSSSIKPTPTRGPLALLSGHIAPVSSTTFDANTPDGSIAYSASWDHSVKTWDLATSTCLSTRTTAQSLLSLCHLPTPGLLAVGTSARHITLVDPREAATAVAALTLRGHTNAVVGLASAPVANSAPISTEDGLSTGYGPHHLVSASHDGTCRVWDLRSVRREAGSGGERVGEGVFVIEREGKTAKVAGDGNKVFDVCWDAEVGIVSAGEDKKVQVNKN